MKSGKTDTRLYVVMGVAGCGKSTIAEGIAHQIQGTYLDGDSFHPQENISKMSEGKPLTDEDRWPWLTTFGKEIAARTGLVVGACSSLKRSYRDHISRCAKEPVLFIYLDGSKELISSRMNARTGHFMPPSLLKSQFDTLEVPDASESAVHVDISGTPDQVIKDAVAHISREDTRHCS